MIKWTTLMNSYISLHTALHLDFSYSKEHEIDLLISQGAIDFYY